MAEDTSANPSAEEPGKTGAEAEGSSEQGGFAEAFAERAAPQAEAKPPEQAADTSAATQAPPADQAGGGEAPSKEAADTSSGPKADAFDPYAGMTPELKAHWEKVAASERSQRGRVGALSKKLQGLSGTQPPPKQQTEERREAGDDGAQATDTGSTGEGKSEASNIEARLKAVTDEYGDIVGPVAEIVQELRKEVEGLKASATRHEVDQDAQARAEAFAELEKAHPDFRDYNEQNEKFVEWFKEQPAGVQALANSFDPKEVSLALRLFKAEGAAASDASTEAGEGGNGGTATGDRRERQMDGLKQAPNRGAPAAAGTPNDFGSAFKARAATAR
jgi:hypothetical protein